MAKKNGFSPEQHAKTAAALGAARAAVFDAWSEAMKAYPIDGDVYRGLCKAGRALDRAMIRLQDASQDENRFTKYGDGSGCGWG